MADNEEEYDPVPDAIVREVVRRLETTFHKAWRVSIGITTFFTIVEDTLNAANRVPSLLHTSCVPVYQYRELEGQYNEQYHDFTDTQDRLHRDIAELRSQLARHEADLRLQRNNLLRDATDNS